MARSRTHSCGIMQQIAPAVFSIVEVEPRRALHDLLPTSDDAKDCSVSAAHCKAGARHASVTFASNCVGWPLRRLAGNLFARSIHVSSKRPHHGGSGVPSIGGSDLNTFRCTCWSCVQAAMPISEVEGASQQSRPCRFLQPGKSHHLPRSGSRQGHLLCRFSQTFTKQTTKGQREAHERADLPGYIGIHT
jgi:hypothetical protein